MKTNIFRSKKWILGILLAILGVILLAGEPSIELPEPPVLSSVDATPIMTTTSTVTSTMPPKNNTRKEPYQTVRLAWFYKPPDAFMLPVIAQNFDVFILTHKDEAERDRLKSLGVKEPFLAYLQLLEIKNPGSCLKDPQGNQVAYEAGDFCMVSQQHPDWFLLDQNGNRIVNGKSFYMDPGNVEYRLFWLQRARALQQQYHWDGIFIDNLEASLSKLNNRGIVPAKYPDDASFQAAIEGFLDYLDRNYFELHKLPIMANIISVRDRRVWLHYLQYLDGAMIESFAVDWSSGYRPVADWEDQMAAIDQALLQGKSLILVSQGERPQDVQREQFAFASYLLISDDSVSFRYAHSGSYSEVLLYDNYFIDLGEPLAPRYKEGASWRRDFTRGYVVVNPKTYQVEIKRALLNWSGKIRE